MLVALVIPFAVGLRWNGIPASEQFYCPLPILAAILITHLLVLKFSSYPGGHPLTTALLASSIGFGAIAISIMSTHGEHSFALLLWGYAGVIVWYVAIGILQASYFVPRLALVPIGRTDELRRLGTFQWFPLYDPLPLSSATETQGIVVDFRAAIPSEWEEFVIQCGTAGIPIFDSKNIREKITGQVDLSALSNIEFDALSPADAYRRVKSIVDVLVATLALPLVVPMIGIVAVAIKLDSPGPVFSVQKRMGFGGQLFNHYKLRSRHISDGSRGPRMTVESDHCITRVGRVIRKYRLDELPQIFNVLKGEMSCIGPRPEAKELSNLYGQQLPYYFLRHAVKPGISGWAVITQGNVAQINDASANLSYDLFYIKHLSLSLDTLIVAKIVWAVLTGARST